LPSIWSAHGSYSGVLLAWLGRCHAAAFPDGLALGLPDRAEITAQLEPAGRRTVVYRVIIIGVILASLVPFASKRLAA
jgi:hypothetical protein